MNVVLFSDRCWDLDDAKDTFPIEHVPDSLKFYQTRSRFKFRPVSLILLIG